ncbi:MAG: YdcF family protein [Bacteroidetes bacterium]|nr:YdcF family protein [Bacteroidota bacterium]
MNFCALHPLKRILLFSIALLWLSGCKLYYKKFYSEPDECMAKARLQKPYDVIIVPGYPSDSGKINIVLSERLRWAAYLYKNGYTKNIIFSGAAVYTPYKEAVVLKLYAKQLGLPETILYTETKAEHTTENLYYSCLMAQELGFKKIGFASQTAHTSFMKAFPKRYGLTCDMLPAILDSVNTIPHQFTTVNAQEAFVADFVLIEKRQSKIQRLRGTRGHRVKKEIRKRKRAQRKSKNKSN